MKITGITAHVMGIPGPGGHAPARNWIFVRVETDAGITGVGEATTEYHEQAVAAMVEHHYAPLLEGQDPTRVTGAWQNTTLAGAVELAPLLNQQEPELNRAGTAAATLNKVGQGVVVAVHGPIFRAYHQAHYPRQRRFVGDMLNALGAANVIRVDGPWWVELSARHKDERMLLQFVNRSSSGHLTPNRHMVEHVPDAGPFTVTIPVAQRPSRVFMAPDETGIEWTWQDGVLKVQIAGLAIHNVLAVER